MSFALRDSVAHAAVKSWLSPTRLPLAAMPRTFLLSLFCLSLAATAPAFAALSAAERTMVASVDAGQAALLMTRLSREAR
ncbi:hypothetical protein [Solimonas variicoloris]|uniref:hypothetical protein n=1 Tax=Solimonas variicoloris TaxID=254408 RepID=UPI0012B529A1|nr:hypothetical protein [Solimonas variicoloris]